MKSHVLYSIIVPSLFVVLLQLTSCDRNRSVPPPPPGGTYRSVTAGASFEQSVQIAGQAGSYIASMPLGEIHRPAHAPDTVYIAAGQAGLVASGDDGASWQIIGVPLSQTLDVVLMPSGIIVVSGIDGAGQGYILRSLDAGKSWEDVLTIPNPAFKKKLNIVGGEEPPTSVLITIEQDPFDKDQVYAGSNLGTLFAGSQSVKVWRSIYTIGGGKPSPAGSVGKLRPSVHDRGEVYVVTGARKLLRISNGKEEAITIPQTISTIPVSGKSNRAVLDVTFIPNYPQALLVSLGDGIIVTRDRGKSWFRLNVPVEATHDFNTVVPRVSPTNVNRILVAVNSVIYRSEDGGNTWITAALGLPNFMIIDVSINPRNAARVLIVVRPLIL